MPNIAARSLNAEIRRLTVYRWESGKARPRLPAWSPYGSSESVRPSIRWRC